MAKYDIAVLGAGPGGYVAAIRAARMGAKVCVIEERELGGTCLNRGCIPTKSLLHSAKIVELAENGKAFGINCGKIEIDFATVMKRKDKVVGDLRSGIESLFKRSKIEVVAGRGKLKSDTEIEVSGVSEAISASKILIATGSSPARPGAFPFDGEKVQDSDEILKSTNLPKSILIVGAGAIGCEYATVYKSLGVDVTLVELLDEVLPLVDVGAAKELHKALKRRKIKVLTKTKIEKLETTPSGVAAELSNGNTVEAERALICVGRRPNSADIGLEDVGITSENGKISIDNNCRTNIPNVYALGDVTGKKMLAHMASKQGLVAVEHALGHDAEIDYRLVPSCVYTHPEVASVGLSEEEARQEGIEYKASSFPFMALGKAHVIGETEGFVKILGDTDIGEVIGVHIVGPHATDLIAGALMAMRLESTVEAVANSIFAHPTLSESLMEAAEVWMDRAIHI